MQAYANATAVVSEAVAGIKTVVAFGAQKKIEKLFKDTLAKEHNKLLRTAVLAGLGQVIA